MPNINNQYTMLHCIQSLEGGGAERQLSFLLGELKKKGWQVHLAVLRGGIYFPKINESGVTIHQLKGLNNYDPRIFGRLFRLVHQIKPKIIQVWLPQMTIIGGIAAILMRVPFIVSERSSLLSYSGTWKHRLRLKIGKKATAIVANSEAGRAYWADQNHYQGYIRIFRNAIPFGEINQVSSKITTEWHIAPDTKLIVYAGRFNQGKNVINLLAALREVLKQRSNTVALFFGEGPLGPELEDMVERYGLGNRLKIMGFTTTLWEWLKRADVFVSVSYFEGQPNTVCEAIACRCPLVLSDIPAHRELLDDESAYFVSHSSIKEMSNAIINILQNPKEAKTKTNKAYNKLKHLTIDKISQGYSDLYNLIISNQI